jgi:NADH-quinone oxidoreductase subunit N
VELSAIVPELVLAAACLVLVPMAGLLRGRWRALVPAVAGSALAAGAAAVLPTLARPARAVFHGTYRLDGLSQVSKLLVLVGALATLAMLAAYLRRHADAAHAPVALVFATLGAVGLTSAHDLGLLLLLLEMTSFGGYLLAALVRGDARALEATLKFLLLGAAALAVMGYGLTFLYGLTGSLDLAEIGAALPGADPAWTGLALALVLVGFGFEIAAVPLHFWMPDVLDGATAPAAGFLSVVPKIAAMTALVRVLVTAFPGELAAWPELVGGLAAATMALGNLAALRQSGLKRLLAYSSVAQAGYVLAAVAAAGRVERAAAAVAFYLAAYLLMNLGAFAFAAQLERTTGTDALARLGGLVRRSPVAALAFAAALLSLAGIPPLAGFAGKVLVLDAALAGGLPWLALIAAANWVVALAYYLRPIARMVLEPAGPATPRLAGALGWIGGALLAGTLALGVLPGAGLEVLGRAASFRLAAGGSSQVPEVGRPPRAGAAANAAGHGAASDVLEPRRGLVHARARRRRRLRAADRRDQGREGAWHRPRAAALDHVRAATHREIGAGHVPRRPRAEEGDGAGDVLRLGEPPQRRVRRDRLVDLRRLVAGRVGDRQPRGDHVHADAVGAQLQGERLREAVERGLRARVGHEARAGDPRQRAAHVDDAAAPPLDHPGGHRLAAEEAGLRLRVELPLVVLPPVLGERDDREVDGGVVDEDVDRAELRLDAADHRLDLRPDGGVGADEDGPPAGGGDLLDDLLPRAAIRDVVHGDLRALAGERLRDGGADPAARSGDDGDLVLHDVLLEVTAGGEGAGRRCATFSNSRIRSRFSSRTSPGLIPAARAGTPESASGASSACRRRPFGVSRTRNARASSRSSRRSTSPLRSMRWRIRVSVVGSWPLRRASSRCVSPSPSARRARTIHCSTVTPRRPNSASRVLVSARSARCTRKPIDSSRT